MYVYTSCMCIHVCVMYIHKCMCIYIYIYTIAAQSHSRGGAEGLVAGADLADGPVPAEELVHLRVRVWQ